MKTKAIITDLDRTLLRTDKSISDYTIDVFRKCRERGIRVMTATARPLRDIPEFRKQIAFDAVTATNGAVIELPDRRLEYGIRRETGEKILAGRMYFCPWRRAADCIRTAISPSGNRLYTGIFRNFRRM